MKHPFISFLLILSFFKLEAQLPGSSDNSFGNLGRIFFQLPDTYTDLGGMKKGADGKIYICGTHGSATGTMGFVARYTYDGQPDNTFNAGSNYVSFQFNNLPTELADLVVRSDGKIIVAGTVEENFYTQHPALARLLPDGTFDPAFGFNGQIIMTQFNARAEVITLLYNNAFAVAGTVYGIDEANLLLMGFLPGGVLNTSFGNNGYQIVDLFYGSTDRPGSMTFYNSRLLVSSIAANGNMTSYDAIVLNAFTENGQPDASFGTGGKVIYDGLEITGSPSIEKVTRHALDASGRIWVASHFAGLGGNDGMLLRFLPSGTPDNSFGNFGMRVYDFGDAETEFNDIGVQLDGKVVVAGQWTLLNFNATLLARFTSDGEFDPQMGQNNSGYVTVPLQAGGTMGDGALRLMFPSYDKVVLGGWCDPGDNLATYLARFFLGITVGQDVINHEKDISVFGDKGNIILTGNGLSEIKSARIYDVQGRLLESYVLGFEKSSGGMLHLELSQALAPGFYVLEIVFPSGNHRMKFNMP